MGLVTTTTPPARLTMQTLRESAQFQDPYGPVDVRSCVIWPLEQG